MTETELLALEKYCLIGVVRGRERSGYLFKIGGEWCLIDGNGSCTVLGDVSKIHLQLKN